LRDMDRYTPAEMERSLRRLADVAKKERTQAIFEHKFND
jgi:hypothetical protein